MTEGKRGEQPEFLSFATDPKGTRLEGRQLLWALDEEILRCARLAAPLLSLQELATFSAGASKDPVAEKRARALRALRQLLERTAPKNHNRVLSIYSNEKLLLSPTLIRAFVMSIDIRQSTELMLNAPPAAFARLISGVAGELARVVKEENGVVDKFTGDGLLACFPIAFVAEEDGLTTPDTAATLDKSPEARAGLGVLRAAKACHERFRATYESNGEIFSVMLAEIGLGIGIDFGEIHTAVVAQSQTIIGEPVVYACRLSSGPPGSTYLNVRAKALLDDTGTILHRTKASLKHKGSAYVWTPNLPTCRSERDRSESADHEA